MGKFQQAIIHGNICAPNSSHFSLKEWEEKFKELGSDETDRAIFAFGQMTNRATTEFHSRLTEVTKISKKNFLKYLASFANYNLMLIGKKIESGLSEIAKGHNTTSIDMLSSIPVHVHGGGTIDARTANENIFPVLKQSSCYINNMNDSDDNITFQTFYDIFKIIAIIATVNSFWTNILSGTYKYENKTNSFTLIDKTEEIRKLISKLRRSNKLVFNKHSALINQPTYPTNAIGYDFLRNGIVVRHANKRELSDIIGELNSADIALDIFFDEQLNGFGGITIGEIWRCYITLRGLREDITEAYLKRDVMSEFDDILHFHNLISKEALITALSQAVNLPPDRAAKAVDVFCYKFDRTEDPAAKFFIPVAEGLIPVLPTMFPQFDFLLSNWLAQGKAKVDKKGGAFEKHIRKKLAGFEQMFDIAIYKSAIKFSAKKTKEEIDLAFIFGNSLFICELKFFQYPADDMGFYQYKKNIMKAVSQIERKTNFVIGNLPAFISKYFPPRPIKKIYSMVITGQFECSGEKVNDTFIIDSSALLSFFSHGRPEVLGSGEISQKIIERYNLNLGYYKDQSTAAEDFISYIENPPQISSLMNGMRIKTTTIFGNVSYEIPWFDTIN